jgi:carbohydrate kinase (thermoresistant glucokinase family)
MTAFILMGVAGSGKTTVGKQVAARLGLPFFEGDEFHPKENIDKMSSGIPLTDADRGPWIDLIVAALNKTEASDAIVACSALSEFVRDRLRSGLTQPPQFVWLSGDPALIEQRLQTRPQHYMKAGMLASQFAALQAPDTAHRIDIRKRVEQVVEDVIGVIERHRTR